MRKRDGWHGTIVAASWNQPRPCSIANSHVFKMATYSPRPAPLPRSTHATLCVRGNLYLWGGRIDGIPEVHDSPAKRIFLSSVDVFQSDCGDWIQRETSGTPQLGVMGYCCAAVGDSLYYILVVTVDMISAIIIVCTS